MSGPDGIGGGGCMASATDPAHLCSVDCVPIFCPFSDDGTCPAGLDRKTWGWGADPAVLAASREKPSPVGLLRSACDDRFQSAFDFEEPA